MSNNFFDCNKINDCGEISDFGCNCNGDSPYPDNGSSYIVGNSVDFSINEFDSEVKADVTVDTRNTVRLWGQIKDCNGKPVPNAYLKLVKMTSNGLVGVAHTISDCLGFYQFDICPNKDGCKFTLLVGKAAMGKERVISGGPNGSSHANCNVCQPTPDFCPPYPNHCK